MFKYILLFLIVIVIFGQLQIISTGQSFVDNFVNYYTNTVRNNKELFHAQMAAFRKKQDRKNSNVSKNQPVVFWSRKGAVEVNSWNYYKKTFISEEGRVIDHQRGSITTSEGQAYAMRRSVMMEDKTTFDKTYDWAKHNLQHKNDKLFAWLWGQKNLGKQTEIEYGIIDNNGASDADVEIAVCLILASKLWNQKSYMDDALKIVNDVWNKETVEIKGERILTTGINQAKTENIEVNPSYFMPYAFRIFAEVDKKHDWQKIVDSSYRLTNWCVDNIESGLPPDFFYINRNTGGITFHKDKCDFSYDAVRVFYRFYVDYTITRDPRAKKLLSKSELFIHRWHHDKKFYTCYKQNRDLKNYNEAIGSIALMLPVIKMYDKNVADEIYKSRIKAKYHSEGYWGNPMDYYAQNLVWLGNWLYLNEESIKSFKY